MTFEAGKSGNPSGRPKGASDKKTSEFKAALNKLLEDASPKLQAWLEEVAKDDPAKALDHLCRLAEYVHPKLARSENETKVSGDMTFGWRSKPPEDEK